MIFAHRHQSTVEHPVQGSGKGKSILHYIRTLARDRPNVGGIDLRTTAAIPQ